MKKYNRRLKPSEDIWLELAHEVRTSVGEMMINISALKRLLFNIPGTDEIKQLCARIEEIGAVQALTVSNILDSETLAIGKISVREDVINIRAWLSASVQTFATRAESKGIKIKFNVRKNVPEAIISDRYLLDRIFQNIVSNALRYTAKGKHIRINISHSLGELKLAIKDEGKGMNKTILEKDPKMSDLTFGRTLKGTSGLGLTIVRNSVDLLGGSLFAETSKIGTGFEIYLPLVKGKTTDRAVALLYEELVNFAATSILVIEDNEALCKGIEIMLRNLGIKNVYISHNGRKGTQLAAAHQPNIILLDYNLPDMKLSTILKKVKASASAGGVTIIGISSTDSIPDDRITDKLPKPFSETMLAALLLKYIDRE